MTSPLFLTPGTFGEPPTLMPTSMTQVQKERWKMKEQQISLDTASEPDWSEVPWRINGVLALTSGIPNGAPDPSAHKLATKAIKKAALSAHHGVSTILLLEVQEKLDLFPSAKTGNENIQMCKLMTIPAG